MKDNTLQDARQEWFSRELKMLNLEFPVAEIVEKTGYTNGIVSMYLNQKRAISLGFMKAFCEAYDIDFDAVNHVIIDEAKKKIIEGQSNNPNDTESKINNYKTIDNQRNKDTLKDNESLVDLEFTNNQTTMTERLMNLAFQALAKKDEQIDRLIGIIENTSEVSKVSADNGSQGKEKAL